MKKTIILTIIGICAIITYVYCKYGNQTTPTNKVEDALNSKVEDFSGDIEEPEKEVFNYNESGKIIIVMYHKFASEEKDEWTRTFDNFLR